MYVQDYDESFPTWNWAWMCRGYNNGAPRSSSNFWTMAVYPYVKNAGIYQCPNDTNKFYDAWAYCSDDGGRDDIFSDFYRNKHVSYGMAENLLGGGVSNVLASIKAPASHLMFGDSVVQVIDLWTNGDPAHAPADQWLATRAAFASGGSVPWWNCCLTAAQWSAALPASTLESATRHSGGSNLSFVDGHAKFFRWQDATNIKLTIGSR
jgi:prepilin-type processing-associated H-X9-DG protein